MATTVRSITVGIALGAAVAATAFLAGARLPFAGTAESATRAEDSADANQVADLLRTADRDDDAALARLAQIDDPRARRNAALALLEGLGGESADIDRIVAALPPAERLNFTFDAIALSAAGDPRGAIAMALALEGSAARTEAITRIAAVLAAGDPRAALQNATAIAEYRLADSFRNALLEEWATLDPDGFFAFLETVGPRDIPTRSEAFRIAASSDPDRLLALLDRLPQNLRSAAELAGFEALARTNSAAAFARIDAMRGGAARNRLLQGAARSLAVHDLAAALAWLEARPSAGPEEISAVLEVLAQTDPVRAVDLLIANVASLGNSSAFRSAIAGFPSGPREELALVADRLSAMDDAAIQVAFGGFMERWTQNDPEAALDWAVANSDRLSTEATGALARNLATSNPELARQAAARLPPDQHVLWFRVVAQLQGREDIDGTLRWLATHQGQPYYEDAVRSAFMGLVDYAGSGDPRAMAAFLDRGSPQMRANSAPMVGHFWAGSDPEAAARWAERVDLGTADPVRRSATFANIAAQWAEHDPDRARDWVLGLPPTTNRDQVLHNLLATTAKSGRLDTSAIDAFISDERRQQSLLVMMPALGRSNPEVGRTLIDRYFDDPEARARAEEALIDGASNRSATVFSGAGIYN